VEIVQYTYVYYLWYTGSSVCMLCCINPDGYWSVETYLGGEGGRGDVLKM